MIISGTVGVYHNAHGYPLFGLRNQNCGEQRAKAKVTTNGNKQMDIHSFSGTPFPPK